MDFIAHAPRYLWPISARRGPAKQIFIPPVLERLVLDSITPPVIPEISNMSSQPRDSQIPTHFDSDIESLARETDMPVATVHEMYQVEHAKLDRVAKIKTYVPVLIRRRVKELLRTQRTKLNIYPLSSPSI